MSWKCIHRLPVRSRKLSVHLQYMRWYSTLYYRQIWEFDPGHVNGLFLWISQTLFRISHVPIWRRFASHGLVPVYDQFCALHPNQPDNYLRRGGKEASPQLHVTRNSTGILISLSLVNGLAGILTFFGNEVKKKKEYYVHVNVVNDTMWSVLQFQL